MKRRRPGSTGPRGVSSRPSPSGCRLGLPPLSGAAAVQLLALARVRPATRASYEASRVACATHLRGRSLQHPHGPELDRTRADYLQVLGGNERAANEFDASVPLDIPLQKLFALMVGLVTGARSLLVVQQRGNLPSAASVRRYDKHGRVGLQL